MFGKRKIIEQQNQLIASQKERLETLEKENAALKKSCLPISPWKTLYPEL